MCGPVKLNTYVLQCDACRVVIIDTTDMHRHGINHCITCGGYKFTVRCSDGSEEKIDLTLKEK